MGNIIEGPFGKKRGETVKRLRDAIVIEGPFGKKDARSRIADSIFISQQGKPKVAPYFSMDETRLFIERPLDVSSVGLDPKQVNKLFRIDEDRLKDPKFVSRQKAIESVLQPYRWSTSPGTVLRVRTKLKRLPRGRKTPVNITVSALALPEVRDPRDVARIVNHLSQTPNNVRPLFGLRRALTQGRMDQLPMIIVPYDISGQGRRGLLLGEAPRVQLESALFQGVASTAVEASKRTGFRNTQNPVVIIPNRQVRRLYITNFNSLLARSLSRARGALNRGRALKAIGTIGAIGAMGDVYKRITRLKEEGRL